MYPGINKFLQSGILLIILSLATIFSYAQAKSFFIPHGDNISEVSCGGVLFAPHYNQNFLAHNAGSVWLRKKIDLSQPFTTSFTVDIIDSLAVDGGAFVFQTDSTSLGESYHGLGFKGIDHSVGITFDTKQNLSQHDPAFDHISIQTNGDLDHSSSNNLAGPVSLEPFYHVTYYPPSNSPERNFHRLVTIAWDPAIKKLSALIDGVLVISAIKDIVQTVFNGNPVVYWGFTASNTQLQWYPATTELTFGHLYFFFGEIFARFNRLPEFDSCYGNPIQFIDSSIYTSGNGADPLLFVNWYWDFGDNTVSTLRNPPPHQYTAPGIYSVKFAITNSAGCTSDTLVKKIGLGSKPEVDFVATPLCTNTAIKFSDQSRADVGTAVAWTWQFDNGNISTDQNPETSFSTPGLHSVSLSVRTEYSCKADTTKISPINEKPIIDYLFTKDCYGNVQYQPALLNTVNVEKWQWDFGDNHFSQQINPSHFFAKDDNYITKLWAVSGECVSDTIKKTIAIDRVDAHAGNDTIAVRNQPVQLNATGGTGYQWYPHNFLNNPFIANPVATLTSDQTYILTVKNSDGCEAKDTLTIKIFDHLDIYVPTAFTPDNDGKNDVLHVIAPGLKQLFYFRIFTRWGQLVFQTTDPRKGWDGRINNQFPNTGVYVWIIQGVDYLGNTIERKGTVTLIR